MDQTPPWESHTDATNPTNSESEQRIAKTMRQVRRELGTKDVVTFALGRAWSVLLVVGAAFVVIAERFANAERSRGDHTQKHKSEE